MDSNYSAERVFFEEDLITTSAIGNITLTNGQATIPAKGKNLKQVFDAIFVEEKNPNATNPAVTVKLTEAGSYEVGTTTTINYKATLSAGSYSYGPATGITASSWSISDSNGHTAETSSGSFEDLLVEDNKIYSITATATHGEGAIPVTNTGNPCDSKKIAAGDKTGTSSTISGYRKTFYGTMTSKPEDIISDDIRALNSSSSALVNGSSFSINIPVGALRVLIAYPAHLRDLTSVLDKNDSNANIVSGFGSPATVKVEGASGYSAIDYKVYKMDFANPYSEANIFTVTI